MADAARGRRMVNHKAAGGCVSWFTFKIGDRVRFKSGLPPGIAIVSEVLADGRLTVRWDVPPPSSSSCQSEDMELARGPAKAR
jgi:uncharacterized protein YodC (DUF2158 family)